MSLSESQKAFAWLVLRDHSKEAGEYLNHFPQEIQKEILEIQSKISGRHQDELLSMARKELRKIAHRPSKSYLADVHSDWLVDVLLNESPMMISTVLRYLPAERAKYILEHLPKRLVESLPSLVETYNVPQGLVKILKAKFEDIFTLHKERPEKQSLQFEHLCLLSADQLQAVFMELGYREIAMGLRSLPKQAQKIVLERLLPKDQFHVETYIKETDKIGSQRFKKAQIHLVSQEQDSSQPEEFVFGLGILILAKSVLLKDEADLKVVKHKLSKAHVKQLEEHIENYSKINTEATVLGYREDIIAAMKKVIQK